MDKWNSLNPSSFCSILEGSKLLAVTYFVLKSDVSHFNLDHPNITGCQAIGLQNDISNSLYFTWGFDSNQLAFGTNYHLTIGKSINELFSYEPDAIPAQDSKTWKPFIGSNIESVTYVKGTYSQFACMIQFPMNHRIVISTGTSEEEANGVSIPGDGDSILVYSESEWGHGKGL